MRDLQSGLALHFN